MIARPIRGALWAVALFSSVAQGQLQPLGAPPVPPGNPQTTAKIALGKALFWDEQLSTTGTVACGSCHRGDGGGADPRSAIPGNQTLHPGGDGQFGNADDRRGSAGVVAHTMGGLYQLDPVFLLSPQVTSRRAQSAINAAYSPRLFWDGRAGGVFVDPNTGQTLLQQGGALENQALGPLVNTGEMGASGSSVQTVAAMIASAKPLAVADRVPVALTDWIAGRRYDALFAEVFGSPGVTPARIAFALASYQRTLAANQTPFDTDLSGTPSLTQQERQGQQVFNNSGCNGCHAGSLLSDNNFHYIGVRPVADDEGRFEQTGNAGDRGAFKTPSLRNVGLRAPYMHNGGLATIEDVVNFYNRGGDFNAPNKDPRVRPLNLNPQNRAALAAFLRRPLIDTRVASEAAPFDRPTLFAESARVPEIVGTGRVGSGGGQPMIMALEPPLLGSTNFTVALHQARPASSATLVVGRADPGLQASVPTGSVATIALTASAQGFASANVDLSMPGLSPGDVLFGRIYVDDPGAADGIAITAAFRATLFGDALGIADRIMQDGFE